jgi:hypothetical protein
MEMILFIFMPCTLDVLGEVKVDLANFIVKFPHKILMYLIFNKISIPAEMSSKSF